MTEWIPKERWISARIDPFLDEWLEEYSRRSKKTKSQVIREALEQYKMVAESRSKGVEIRLEDLSSIQMDDKTYSLLQSIADMLSEPDLSRVLTYIITGFHVILTSGVWRILRPLPELANMVAPEEE